MLKKSLKLWGSRIVQDLGCLILDYIQLIDVLDDGPELDVLNIIRTAWKKTLYLLKNFQRRKEWAVSCRKSLSLAWHQKAMELGTLAAHRSQPFDHTVSNEQVHWVQIWIVQWSVTPSILYMRQPQKRCESWLLVWPAPILRHLCWWMMTMHLLQKHTDWLQLQESNVKSFA